MLSIFRPIIRYVDFKGRAARREYWGFKLSQGLIHLMLLGAMTAFAKNDRPVAAMVCIGVMGVMLAALAIPNLAVLARRLHDSDRAMAWMLLMAPSILWQFALVGTVQKLIGLAAKGASQHEIALALVAGVAGALLLVLAACVCDTILLILTLLPGTAGPNRFGDDPRRAAPDWERAMGGISEERMEQLIAEARSGLAAEPSPRPAAPTWTTPAYDPGVAPARPFGKRT